MATHVGYRRAFAGASAAFLATTVISTVNQPAANGAHLDRHATMRGSGGAVVSVDPSASRVGLRVLRHGGNAVDAAIATAAALGVTEPYSTGIGGGGFFVYYDAKTGKVTTLDGRETAPAAMSHNAFINPATGKPYQFTPQLVTSGVSIGVPGTLGTWSKALHKWGTRSLGSSLRPAIALARHGFRVDKTFHKQTAENALRFRAFPSTKRLYLPGGHPARVGSTFRNPALARTYGLIARRGIKVFYDGAIAHEIARASKHPPKSAHTHLPVPPGTMTRADLAKYKVIERDPTHVTYRGYDVYGMGPVSSGGTTVGEALNILDNFNLSPARMARSLHIYLEASALAYADRNTYVGDPAYVKVPTATLLSQDFADTRACLINVNDAATKPVPAGALHGVCPAARPKPVMAKPDTEGRSTSHLSVVDKWGNAVSYTLTIEQTGGSGLVLPGRGFILNNELTDFTAVYDKDDPNRIAGGKRPRSSMAPTIVLQNGNLRYVLGSPGGATIITTVLQTLINRIDLGMTLPQAVAAPRVSQENATDSYAERRFIRRYGDALKKYGQSFVPPGDPGTTAAQIGAVAAIEVHGRHSQRLLAVAEPTRRGGGDAEVVDRR